MIKKLSIFKILILVLSACAPNNMSINHPLEFDFNYINQQIKLSAPAEFNTFETNQPVGLFLEYDAEKSTGDIYFPPSYNLRIFIKFDNKWVEIKEKPIIRPSEKIKLSKLTPADIVIFYPDLPDQSKEYLMRAYVFGDMNTGDHIDTVTAFVEFKLFP